MPRDRRQNNTKHRGVRKNADIMFTIGFGLFTIGVLLFFIGILLRIIADELAKKRKKVKQ